MQKLPEKKWLTDQSGYTVVNEYGDKVHNSLLEKKLKEDWIIDVLEMIWNELTAWKRTE